MKIPSLPPILLGFMILLASLVSTPSYLYGCWDYSVFPKDTTPEISIDLDRDGLDDFLISILHRSIRCHVEFSKCDEFDYYGTLMQISALQEGDSIRLKNFITLLDYAIDRSGQEFLVAGKTEET